MRKNSQVNVEEEVKSKMKINSTELEVLVEETNKGLMCEVHTGGE